MSSGLKSLHNAFGQHLGKTQLVRIITPFCHVLRHIHFNNLAEGVHRKEYNAAEHRFRAFVHELSGHQE
jgi:hypothetical protein